MISSRQFSKPSAIRKMKISPFFGVLTSFALSLRAWISEASKFSSSCLRPKCLLSKFLQHTMHTQGIFHVKLSYHIDGALAGLSPKSPFIQCFPICSEVLDISQVTATFHRICPPFFIQARLQQHSRRSFFHSAYRSFSNTICLGSMVY